jgi:hypothetical protein
MQERNEGTLEIAKSKESTRMPAVKDSAGFLLNHANKAGHKSSMLLVHGSAAALPLVFA